MAAVDTRLRITIPRLIGAPARFCEQPAAYRRRPGGLLNVRGLEERATAGFRRHCRGAATHVGGGVVLLRPIEVDLVARRGLPCDSSNGVAIHTIAESRATGVEVDRPR